MSLPISRKVEKALASWLPTAMTTTGLTFFEGHERADTIIMPCLVIHAEGSTPYPDMPPDVGIRVVRVRCKFTASSDDHTRATVDGWKELLESAMTDDMAAMQSALNHPATGTDTRVVTGIHFHHVEMTDDPSERFENDWIEDLTFAVVAELVDA